MECDTTCSNERLVPLNLDDNNATIMRWKISGPPPRRFDEIHIGLGGIPSQTYIIKWRANNCLDVCLCRGQRVTEFDAALSSQGNELPHCAVSTVRNVDRGPYLHLFLLAIHTSCSLALLHLFGKYEDLGMEPQLFRGTKNIVSLHYSWAYWKYAL